MSLYLRLVVGPVVVCDVELFASKDTPKGDEPPPQLNGGSGTVMFPEVEGGVAFGFTKQPKASDRAREAVEAIVRYCEGAMCHHCGRLPDDDGDHSCPCPYQDDECPDHPQATASEQGESRG